MYMVTGCQSHIKTRDGLPTETRSWL